MTKTVPKIRLVHKHLAIGKLKGYVRETNAQRICVLLKITYKKLKQTTNKTKIT